MCYAVSTLYQPPNVIYYMTYKCYILYDMTLALAALHNIGIHIPLAIAAFVLYTLALAALHNIGIHITLAIAAFVCWTLHCIVTDK